MASIEQEIEQAIISQKRWADLDNRMRDLIGSSQEYDKKILRHSIEFQLRYRGNLVRFVVDEERQYYVELLKHSSDRLMLFPYHLSDFVITGMRITPFQFYLKTIAQMIEQEKSYDSLPNFTAVDCLRLLGIGRNQYIDIMNRYRSIPRSNRLFKMLGYERRPYHLLPNKPDEQVPIEPWWFVNAGYITEDDVRSMVSSDERAIIDRLVTRSGLYNQILACDLHEPHVRSLYLKGLIYLDVPIYDDDYIVVPPLESFVMNRDSVNHFEKLLYKVFVSIDQSTTVQELANILNIDIRLVKDAVSLYCRLNFAYKKNIYIDTTRCDPSWQEKLNGYRKMGINVMQQQNRLDNNGLSPEVSVEASRHLSDFINELASVQDSDRGTEVLDNPPNIHDQQQQHPVMSNPDVQAKSQDSPRPVLTHSPSISVSQAKKIVLFCDSTLAGMLMLGNLSTELKKHAVTMYEVGKLSDEWIDSLQNELSKINSDMIEEDSYDAKGAFTHALLLHRTIEFVRNDLRMAITSPHDSTTLDESQRLGLDLIRIESLSTLDIESCERFLKKNYRLIISFAPLSQCDVMSATSSLPHLGPGSPLINSLWFRLYIYSLTGFGPPSLLLLQGYRLKRLPEVLSRSSALLINHWDRYPTCVPTNNALIAINDALTRSPILVQTYPIHLVGGNYSSNDEKVFIPLPLTDQLDTSDQFENNLTVKKLSQLMDLNDVCGFLTLLKSETGEHTLFDCQFGIPLFDKTLNEEVKRRILSRKLCEPESLKRLLTATRNLNAKVKSFVDRYRINQDMEAIDTSDSGDQRHFFAFPDSKEFRSDVPRPAENLLFYEGALSVFRESPSLE